METGMNEEGLFQISARNSKFRSSLSGKCRAFPGAKLFLKDKINEQIHYQNIDLDVAWFG
jgi:hypothetical protein